MRCVPVLIFVMVFSVRSSRSFMVTPDFVSKQAMMKVWQKCIGDTLLRILETEMMSAANDCRNVQMIDLSDIRKEGNFIDSFERPEIVATRTDEATGDDEGGIFSGDNADGGEPQIYDTSGDEAPLGGFDAGIRDENDDDANFYDERDNNRFWDDEGGDNRYPVNNRDWERDRDRETTGGRDTTTRGNGRDRETSTRGPGEDRGTMFSGYGEDRNTAGGQGGDRWSKPNGNRGGDRETTTRGNSDYGGDRDAATRGNGEGRGTERNRNKVSNQMKNKIRNKSRNNNGTNNRNGNFRENNEGGNGSNKRVKNRGREYKNFPIVDYLNPKQNANRNGDSPSLGRRTSADKPVYFTLVDQVPFLLQNERTIDLSVRPKRQAAGLRHPISFSVQELVDGENELRAHLSNFSCVMQKLNLVDRSGNLQMGQIISNIEEYPIDPDLKSDLLDVVNECWRMTDCLPNDDDETLITRYQEIAFNFFKCTETRRLLACLKKDIREDLRAAIPANKMNPVEMERTVKRILYIKMADSFSDILSALS